MSKKILIFGSQGMLGQEFINYFGNKKEYEVVILDRKTADISCFNIIFKAVKKHKPDIVINCAAIINVDYCENHPTDAWQVNAIGPGIIIKAINQSKLFKTTFFQISTSDVFGNIGKNSFKESDYPKPVNVYGWSKLGGEKIIEAEAKINNIKYFIIRTSWLYSQYKDTFVDYVVKSLKDSKNINIIFDQYNTITWTKDFVKACENFIKFNQKYKSGIYHLASIATKKLSKYDIALKIAQILNLNKKYLKKKSKDDIFKSTRPKAAILTNNQFISMPNWQKSLSKYLRLKYGK